MKRNYKYRIFPSKKQESLLLATLEECRWTYNKILDTRIKAYETEKKTLNKYATNNLKLMIDGGAQAMCGGMHCFHTIGQVLLAIKDNSPVPPEPKKLTRSQKRYQEYKDSDCSESFGEWLTELKGWKKEALDFC